MHVYRYFGGKKEAEKNILVMWLTRLLEGAIHTRDILFYNV